MSIDIKLFGGNVIYNDVIDVFDTELEFILGEIDEQESFLELIRQDINDYYIWSSFILKNYKIIIKQFWIKM